MVELVLHGCSLVKAKPPFVQFYNRMGLNRVNQTLLPGRLEGLAKGGLAFFIFFCLLLLYVQGLDRERPCTVDQ